MQSRSSLTQGPKGCSSAQHRAVLKANRLSHRYGAKVTQYATELADDMLFYCALRPLALVENDDRR
jgi:hypothetical protein